MVLCAGYGIGGGIPNGKKFKAVQIGGPSGGLLVEEHLDLPLHFQKLKPYGVRRGDSVITVLDEDRCMVDVACRFMQYTQTEFCGKCVPCREGTKRMNELLWAMRDYRLSESDFHMPVIPFTSPPLETLFVGNGSTFPHPCVLV